MKPFALRYGSSLLPVSLPDDAELLVPPPSSSPALDAASLGDRLSAAGLEHALGSARRIALVVNDQTRRAGVRALLDAIVPRIPRSSSIELVIAYGLHACQPDEVSRSLYGEAHLARGRLVHHDADDASTLVDVGSLASGARLSLCRSVVDVELSILLGGLGFHYHAGFSGGRKAIFPGVADRASIERNHLRVLDPTGPNGRAIGCAPARLDGNPVSEELMEGPRLLEQRGGRVFLANAMIDADGAIVDLAAGLDHEESFRRGGERLVARMSVQLSTRPAFEAVIASAGGWPYDASLYQAHKAYDNAYRALLPRITMQERPTLILLARCDEGLGHDRFMHWLSYPTRQAHYEALMNEYEIVGQTSLAVRDKADQTRTIAVTELPRDVCARLGWERAASIEDALALAGDRRFAVMPAAAQTLPLA